MPTDQACMHRATSTCTPPSPHPLVEKTVKMHLPEAQKQPECTCFCMLTGHYGQASQHPEAVMHVHLNATAPFKVRRPIMITTTTTVPTSRFWIVFVTGLSPGLALVPCEGRHMHSEADRQQNNCLCSMAPCSATHQASKNTARAPSR